MLALVPAIAADLEWVRATVEPQQERVAAIERGLAILPGLAADVEGVRAIVEPQHERVAGIEQAVARVDLHLSELQRTLAVLKGDVEDATERLPDPRRPMDPSRASAKPSQDAPEAGGVRRTPLKSGVLPGGEEGSTVYARPEEVQR